MATTLLLLRATDLLRDSRSITAATSVAILLYVGHNAAASACSLLAGRLADRIAPRPVFAAAGIVYVAGYTVFAIGPQTWRLLLVGFLLAGVGIGAAEPAESTVVAHSLPETLRGNGFRILVQAIGDMGSTVVAGLPWSLLSPTIAFGYVAAWMLLSVTTSTMLRPHRSQPDK